MPTERSLSTVARAVDALVLRELALCTARCPFCGPTLILRLRQEETAVRCLRCRASAVHLSLGWALNALPLAWVDCAAYELSARGPLVAALRQRAASLTVSEWLEDVPPGEIHNSVRCEDVQRLTFADASFDVITHTEVFEHVADDSAGFRELYRVLRPGGWTVFTVPLTGAESTVERARRQGNDIHHLLPPTYHGDRLRGPGQVLCFRDYGNDIVARLAAAGFADATILPPDARVPWGFGRPVVQARRPR